MKCDDAVDSRRQNRVVQRKSADDGANASQL